LSEIKHLLAPYFINNIDISFVPMLCVGMHTLAVGRVRYEWESSR